MSDEKNNEILITYKQANGEPVWGEYAFVCGMEYFEECDEPVELIKETWQLVGSEKLTVGKVEEVEEVE